MSLCQFKDKGREARLGGLAKCGEGIRSMWGKHLIGSFYLLFDILNQYIKGTTCQF